METILQMTLQHSQSQCARASPSCPLNLPFSLLQVALQKYQLALIEQSADQLLAWNQPRSAQRSSLWRFVDPEAQNLNPLAQNLNLLALWYHLPKSEGYYLL